MGLKLTRSHLHVGPDIGFGEGCSSNDDRMLLLESFKVDFADAQIVVANIKMYLGRLGVFEYTPRGGDTATTEYRALSEIFVAAGGEVPAVTGPLAPVKGRSKPDGWRSSANWLSSSKLEAWEGVKIGRNGSRDFVQLFLIFVLHR